MVYIFKFETLKDRNEGDLDKAALLGVAKSPKELVSIVKANKGKYLAYLKTVDYDGAFSELGGTVVRTEKSLAAFYFDKNGKPIA